MDKLSIFGLLLAIIAIYFGFVIDGGSIQALLEFPAFVIVVGGSIGAVMLQSSPKQFIHAMQLLKWVFSPPQNDIDKGISDIVLWSNKAREQGFLALEDIAEQEQDVFVNKSLLLLVDGVDVDNLAESLELEIELYREHHLRTIKVFESLGGYSPTIGILGAVLGLIHAMSNLSDPELLGQGIATAFVATIYGVGFANLLFIPIANKIKHVLYQQTLYQEMMAQGILSIALAQNPKAIENKLSAYRFE